MAEDMGREQPQRSRSRTIEPSERNSTVSSGKKKRMRKQQQSEEES